MEIKYLIKGIVIGFSIAAPVGPIGLLCIKRSLTHGASAGLATGLGAATADAVYGCLAGFGLTVITGFLLDIKCLLHLAGGLFLIFLGWQSFKRKPTPRDNANTPFQGYVSAYLSALALTLTNPMTIMAFMAIFAGLGLAATDKGYAASATLVAGVFSGSALWWLILTFGTAKIGRHLNPGFQNSINRLSSIILMSFGAWAVITLAG